MLTPVEPQQFVSIVEAANHLGLSTSTVRRRIRDGSFPSYQPGGPGTRVLMSLEAIYTALSASGGGNMDVPSRPSISSDDKTKLSGPPPKWKRERRTTRT